MSNQTQVCPPNTFNRSNPEDLRTFLLQCQITFNLYPQQYVTHSTKIFFMISYLKKSALEWFEQGILEDDPRFTPVWRSSWPEFVNELQTHFSPVNPTGAAESELHHLTMAPSSQLVEYLVQFNTLASRVAWGKAALCFQFYDGLPNHLKDHLAILGKPNSLRELVHTTQCFDTLYWERQDEQKLAMARDSRPTGTPP